VRVSGGSVCQASITRPRDNAAAPPPDAGGVVRIWRVARRGWGGHKARPGGDTWLGTSLPAGEQRQPT